MFNWFKPKKKLSKSEMCETLSLLLFSRKYNPGEAREILLETIGLMDSYSAGMEQNALHSDTIRVLLALPTVMNLSWYHAKKDEDTTQAFIATLQEMLDIAKNQN